jgi:hypothetical protein
MPNAQNVRENLVVFFEIMSLPLSVRPRPVLAALARHNQV